MMKRETEQRQAIEMLCVDMLTPKDHLLRKIDAAVDFTHIYELVEDLYCEDNGRPELRSCGAVQAGADPASVRDPFAAADHAGRRSKRGVSLVSGVYDVAESSALCDDQLCVLPSLYGGSDRRRIPLDTGGSGPGGVSVAGGGICGRNAHQGEREPEEAREEGDSRGGEAVSGAAGRGDRSGSSGAREKAPEKEE